MLDWIDRGVTLVKDIALSADQIKKQRIRVKQFDTTISNAGNNEVISGRNHEIIDISANHANRAILDAKEMDSTLKMAQPYIDKLYALSDRKVEIHMCMCVWGCYCIYVCMYIYLHRCMNLQAHTYVFMCTCVETLKYVDCGCHTCIYPGG
jgi:hypothetical protein